MPPTKGIRVKIGGQSRTLRYTTYALDRLESETNLAQSQVIQRAEIGSVRYMVWLVWAGFVHEDRSLSRDTVIEWLDDMTPEEEKALTTAVESAFKDQSPEEEEEGGDKGNLQAAS